jgi:plastocyanin
LQGRFGMKGLLAIWLVMLAAIACSPAASSGTVNSPRPSASEPIDPSAPSIVYSDEGFTPDRLEIRLGQQVRFVNESQKPFWPASNIHPTHRIYPEFDASQPIPSGETWAFTFDRAGFWRFHNHLAPQMSGLVVVRDDRAAAPQEPLVIEMPDVEFQSPENVPARDYIELLRDDGLLTEYIRK